MSKWRYYVFYQILHKLSYKWPSFWYLKFLFQLNLFVGYISHFGGIELRNTSDFFYNMLLIYLYFKMPKWLSIWIPPLCSRGKKLFLHKEIIEKRCQKSLVKIFSSLWDIQLIGLCYNVTSYAIDTQKFLELLEEIADSPG